MQRSLGWRIGRGYAIILSLLVLVAFTGLYATSGAVNRYQVVIQEREVILNGALKVHSGIEEAVAAFLRYQLLGGDSYLTEWNDAYGRAHQAASLLTDAVAPDQRKPWQELVTLVGAWGDKAEVSIAARKNGNIDEAMQVHQSQVWPARAEMTAAIERLVAAQAEYVEQATHAANDQAEFLSWITILAALAGVGSGIGLALSLTRTITKTIQGSISALAAAATEVLAATAQQASGIAEQGAAVNETTTTVEEVKQTVYVSSDKARMVADAAQRSVETSRDGRKSVEESARLMQETRKQMEAIAGRILALSAHGQDIGEIITTVTQIADQSNLLAVNASIEAAKAGEAGRGFAVVAAEMKQLAEQSKQGTGQVRRILQEIARATQAAVMAVEQGVKASEAGEAAGVHSGGAIRALTESLAESAQAAQQILVSAQQQVVGMDQVELAMQNIHQASTQTIAATRQLERAAQDLNDLARRLQEVVSGAAHTA
ncbi:MAG TPA: methyl-accepting chemotaxis protein [Symbiobacteriaceae bacterium]|nr:methyl-accepting chemotaxis protein [Symbiobacteriaceae bacterium]